MYTMKLSSQSSHRKAIVNEENNRYKTTFCLLGVLHSQLHASLLQVGNLLCLVDNSLFLHSCHITGRFQCLRREYLHLFSHKGFWCIYDLTEIS